MAQVTGRVFIKVDGRLYNSKTGSKMTYVAADGVASRVAEVADSGVIGFRNIAGAPDITATFIHAADVSLETLMAITDATITFQSDAGPAFSIANGFCKGATLSSVGEIETSFSGQPPIEV